MRPLRNTLKVLTISPLLPLHCSGCRNIPRTFQLELRAQCPSWNQDLATSAKRFSTSSTYRSTSPPRFKYGIAASFVAKGLRLKDDGNHLYDYLDKDGSTPFTGGTASGQDAFFAAKYDGEDGEGAAFGVADGVGGWMESGIDPAAFSHGLCLEMAKKAGQGPRKGLDAASMSPKALLDQAYSKIVEEGEIEGGGSTACLAAVTSDGNLTVANLGDSGYVQLRPGAIAHYSDPQTHAFNTPYQLSVIPPAMLAQSRAFGGGPLHDLPEAADVATHQVRHGDVLILATDGVWDNIDAAEIQNFVSNRMRARRGWDRREGSLKATGKLRSLTGMEEDDGKAAKTLQAELAYGIAQEAKAASLNTKRDGPFAKEVQKAFPGESYHGGKSDDICVVVVVVVGTT